MQRLLNVVQLHVKGICSDIDVMMWNWAILDIQYMQLCRLIEHDPCILVPCFCIFIQWPLHLYTHAFIRFSFLFVWVGLFETVCCCCFIALSCYVPAKIRALGSTGWKEKLPVPGQVQYIRALSSTFSIIIFQWCSWSYLKSLCSVYSTLQLPFLQPDG